MEAAIKLNAERLSKDLIRSQTNFFLPFGPQSPSHHYQWREMEMKNKLMRLTVGFISQVRLHLIAIICDGFLFGIRNDCGFARDNVKIVFRYNRKVKRSSGCAGEC